MSRRCETRVRAATDHLGCKKVTILCSSAIVQGIVEGTIEWTEDPDFGYQVAAAIRDVDDIEGPPAAAALLQAGPNG